MSTPLVRGGRSSLVPRGPWSYGMTGIAVHGSVEGGLEAVLPRGAEATGDVFFYVADIVSVSDWWPELNIEAPDLVQYSEAAILVGVRLNGGSYAYCPYMWVTTDLSLMRGFVAGFPKKIASIHLTKLHPSLPGLRGPGRGVRLGGFAARSSYTLLRLKVRLEGEVDEWPLDRLGPWLLPRVFPSPGGGLGGVRELVALKLSYLGGRVIWAGDGELEVLGGVNDELDMFRDVEIAGGYFFQMGLRIADIRVVSREL